MRRRDPFALVLGVLSAQLRAGRWSMGEPLSIADLAQELKFSTTPVREALAFLAGQGAIEDTRGSGYVFGRLDDAGLLDLYELHEVFVLHALETRAADAAAPAALASLAETLHLDDGAPDAADATRRLFEAVVASGGNRLIERHHLALGMLLGRARKVEASVFPDLKDELVALCTALSEFPKEVQKDAVRRYGARRINNISLLQARATREHALKYTSNIS